MRDSVAKSGEIKAPPAHAHAVRLLRCRRTNQYFTGNGWTQTLEEAQAYPDEIHAAKTCVSNNLHDVDLVLLSSVSGTEIFSTAVR